MPVSGTSGNGIAFLYCIGIYASGLKTSHNEGTTIQGTRENMRLKGRVQINEFI